MPHIFAVDVLIGGKHVEAQVQFMSMGTDGDADDGRQPFVLIQSTRDTSFPARCLIAAQTGTQHVARFLEENQVRSLMGGLADNAGECDPFPACDHLLVSLAIATARILQSQVESVTQETG